MTIASILMVWSMPVVSFVMTRSYQNRHMSESDVVCSRQWMILQLQIDGLLKHNSETSQARFFFFKQLNSLHFYQLVKRIACRISTHARSTLYILTITGIAACMCAALSAYFESQRRVLFEVFDYYYFSDRCANYCKGCGRWILDVVYDYILRSR